jgi:hypothetical protein
MFDALQEGIIIVQGNEVKMMNDLSKKLLAATFGLKNNAASIQNLTDIFKNISEKDIMDQKMFYVYDQDKKDDKKKKKAREKKSS